MLNKQFGTSDTKHSIEDVTVLKMLIQTYLYITTQIQTVDCGSKNKIIPRKAS